MPNRIRWINLLLPALIALGSSAILWSAHELVDSSSARALLSERASGAAAALKDHDARLQQLEIAFARQAQATETISRVLERLEDRIERNQEARK